MRVQAAQAILRRRKLRAPHVRRSMQQLALQVAEVNDVEVDDADTSHTGGGEVHRSRRSETTRADAEDTSGFQLLLSVDADLRHDEMPRVPFDLVGVQLSGRSGADPWVRGFRRSPTR